MNAENDLQSKMWSSRGFTLHTTKSGNYYLLMEFSESAFIVRDAVSTFQIPSDRGRLKVYARNRDLCQMVGQPREVCGIEALEALIESWRYEAFRPVAHIHVRNCHP